MKIKILFIIGFVVILLIGYLTQSDYLFERKLNVEEVKCGYGDKKTMDCLYITSSRISIDEVKNNERIMENYNGWTTMNLDWSGMLLVKEDKYLEYLNDYVLGGKDE